MSLKEKYNLKMTSHIKDNYFKTPKRSIKASAALEVYMLATVTAYSQVYITLNHNLQKLFQQNTKIKQ
jgi:hypothetical protein